MSCKRKRTNALCSFVNDSDDGAALSVLPADELYANCSGIRSPHKKCRVKERPRFHQSIDEDSNVTCSDEVQMFGNHNSSMCHTNSAEEMYVNDQQHVLSTAGEHQSANFEELLFALVLENECSQVFSQKCGTAGVTECTREQVQADVCNSLNDANSDMHNSHIPRDTDANSQFFVERNNSHLDRISGLLSRDALNSCNSPSAADSEFHTLNACSVSSKTDLLQSAKKQNKNVKPEEWATNYSKLWNRSECFEKKPKHKRCHTFTSLTQTETVSHKSDECGLLRIVHRMVNRQVFTRTIVESDSVDVLKPVKKRKQHGRSKKVTKDWTDFEGSHSTRNRKKRHHEHLSSSLLSNICSASDNRSVSLHEPGCEGNKNRVIDSYSVETAAAVDHLDTSFQNTEVESDNNDCSLTVPTSCSKQNVLEKQATVTVDCTGPKELLPLPQKRKKKKRHREHDRMSTYTAELQRTTVDKSSAACPAGVSLPVSNSCLEQDVSHTDYVGSGENGYTDLSKLGKKQKHQKITEVENWCTIKNEVCKKSSNSVFTPCKNKSGKKTTSEYTSPSVCSDSSNITIQSPKVRGTVNIPKTDYTDDSSQTAGVLFRDSLGYSVNNSEDLLLEENLCEEHDTNLCANASVHMNSEEDGFEQLLLNVLVGSKSPVLSHSDNDKSRSEDHDVSTKEPGHKHVLSDSTSDDDLDDMVVAKQHTSVNSLPASSQTDSDMYKFGLCTRKSNDKKMMPVNCDSEVKKSQHHSACSLDRSPSLLDSTLLQGVDCDMKSPVDLEKEVNAIDRSTPIAADASVTPDKSVWCYFENFSMSFVEQL